MTQETARLKHGMLQVQRERGWTDQYCHLTPGRFCGDHCPMLMCSNVDYDPDGRPLPGVRFGCANRGGAWFLMEGKS